MPESVLVYADWIGMKQPTLLGVLHSRRLRAGERMEFEFDQSALSGALAQEHLDPRIAPYPGRQFPPAGADSFGLVADASPDRWGRLLMERKLDRDIRSGVVATGTRLFASDYLIGVHDGYRSGGLRFKTEPDGPFLDNHIRQAAPPMTSMRELEEASRRFEEGEDTGAAGQDWIHMLIAPGGSLGGARPKASVMHEDNSLWIGKFPSSRDQYDVGAWEMLVNILANGCGLNVAQAMAQRYTSDFHCFMVKRFDRSPTGERIHFASAMTLTEHQDGDDHQSGASYLEIADVIMRHGSHPTEDLRELWRRIVFNMLVSNTDDHLRNHGFLLEPRRGWRLSPAYDMNPAAHQTGLRINVSETDNALDLELALSVAGLFRVPHEEANRIITRFISVVTQWPRVADGLSIKRQEQARMASAFALAI